MHDPIHDIETIAVNTSIRDLERLKKMYGKGRWRKLKGIAHVARSVSARRVLGNPIVSHCCGSRTGPRTAQALHAELIDGGTELLAVSTESMGLLNKYLEKEILGPRFQNDMLHIALATIANVDVLVSWNFRHIVRLDKIRPFNSVNIECGYKSLTIYSPREVVPGETDS